MAFREVFAESEYRALWLAQLVSIAGDQFARIALAVLVYQRTGSPLASAAAFGATILAAFAGGLLFGWTADAWPRRAVMVGCDLGCAALVAVMAVPGLPLWSLLVLLSLVSLALEPFIAARMATNKAILGPDRFQAGVGITISTYQAAQLAGFVLGGAVTAAAGVRAALLIDAASFAASAALIRFGVRARPAPGGPARMKRLGWLDGARLVFASPVARIAMLLMWLAAFFNAPEGVSVPLAGSFGGGPVLAGWLLATMCAGAIAGPLVWTSDRLVPPGPRMRATALLATAACAVLTGFGPGPPLGVALVLLAVSGACSGYIASASGALFEAIPAEHQGKASGVVGAGMTLGQGVLVLVAGALAQWTSAASSIAWIGAAGALCAAPLAVRWSRLSRGSACASASAHHS